MTGLTHFDILGFGAVAVDDLLYVDEYPPPEPLGEGDNSLHVDRS